MNQRKEKSAKYFSVAARREIKWMQLKAKPSTLYARYRGKAARSHENLPALGATSLTREVLNYPPCKGGMGGFRPVVGSCRTCTKCDSEAQRLNAPAFNDIHLVLHCAAVL